MKIVIAIDSYKGCCSTFEAADAVERGFRKYSKEVELVKIPVADGGEGTVDTLVYGLEGRYEEVEVSNPLGNKITSKYGILPDKIAVIEMASASGLTLLDRDEYNPLVTTTYGVGQLIKDALDKDCRRVYIGLGGSATNDGGVGMAQALGISFKDKNGIEIGFGGGELAKINSIDISNRDRRLDNMEVIIFSDVINTLCGHEGASYIYGEQKGATPEVIKVLDSNLLHYGHIVDRELGIDIINTPGAGAAGGLGAALIAFCGAKHNSGVEKILDILAIEEHFKDADLVITGEGRIDSQTIFGKVPVGIASRAKKYDLPVIAIVGSIGDGAEVVYEYGVDAILSIIPRPMTLNEALEEGVLLIEKLAENIMAILNTKTRRFGI